MAKNNKKSNKDVVWEIVVAVVLAILIWNLGIITFIGYVLAFIGAIKNGLFKNRRDMAAKLFIGTILIYSAGLLAPTIFNTLKSGDMISGIIMLIFAAYLLIKGFFARKFGKEV